MKQPRASSQWKLPLWVPTRLRGAVVGEPVEKVETLDFTIREKWECFGVRETNSLCRPQTVKCNSNNNDCSPSEKGSLKDVLSGMVDQRVEELLNKEENRGLLDGLGKATERVEIARRELAEIKKQEIEAQQLRDYINQLENRASEIAECQRDITEARALVEEAERSLTVDGVGGRDAFTEIELEAINKNEERWESIKAASISAVVGTLAGLPISLTQVTSFPQLILPSAITFVSCALFGVTFRYAVRRDFDNFQLKNGTAAAFGFVKGAFCKEIPLGDIDQNRASLEANEGSEALGYQAAGKEPFGFRCGFF
ncbi:hypothetical protein RJ640_019133 [Escallonia rubra]|uniref:Uncharacterized protein n=1 Tax=Escallonia rubra TaxID=112253 RepID=A0AA88UGT1_9ASTE|nr:hypothetical protein RJ640_019133 [Escallonia rubra]